MTKQEAIYYIESQRHGWKIPNEAIDVAIECIEKQIPQKPIIEYMPLFKAYCPICEGRLLPSKWCAKCGQAIDWESYNE